MDHGTPSRIAVVDDEEHILRAMDRLLRSVGLQAELFQGGEAFLASLRERRPGCVVLDLHMPQPDGFAVLERMSRMEVDVPVMVITGDDTPESQARVMAAGAAAYFRKPVDGDRLLHAIQEVARA